MHKLISFVIRAEKGFFKKPDINEGIYLTFNMLHKPALLGILGAIIGLEGYKENGVLPEYYKKLQNIPVGIEPIGDDKGNFQKTVISYTNTTGFASKEEGGNLIISEQTLINPAYKIYLLLKIEREDHKKLYHFIKEQRAEYLPYLGKNDYSLWWNKDKVKEYNFNKLNKINMPFRIKTIFIKKTTLKENIYEDENLNIFFNTGGLEENTFAYFERLPVCFDTKLYQYKYADFVYTNFKLKTENKIDNLYKLDDDSIVFLF